MSLKDTLSVAWKNRYLRYGSILAALVVVLLLFYRKPPVSTEIYRVARGNY